MVLVEEIMSPSFNVVTGLLNHKIKQKNLTSFNTFSCLFFVLPIKNQI